MFQDSISCGPTFPARVKSSRPIRLRICGTSRNGEIIEVVSRRVTIGSAPNCVVRLRAKSVRPVECLLLREPNALVARCLSISALLNGNPFRQAQINLGDLLQ